MTSGVLSFGCNNAWQNLALGAGGFISGVDLHSDGTKIIRTDTSGAFLYNSGLSKWVCITNPVSLANTGDPSDIALGSLNGVYEIRIAPTNSSRLYMMYGPSTNNVLVYRSDDKGTSWIRTALSPISVASANANDGMRGDSPKMAIDPANADVVVVSSQAGVSYSLDAGGSWTNTSVPSATGTASGNGILVKYDPNSSVSGGKTQGIYAASFGNGVYHTTTGANGTWSLVASSPAIAYATLVVTADGTLLVGNDSSTTIRRLASGSWTSPTIGTNGVRGLTVNPSNSLQAWGVDSTGAISYSSDNGATWSGFSGGHSLTSTDIPWLTYTHTSVNLQPGATLAYDPSGSNKLYLGFGLGIASATAPTSATSVAWTDLSVGIEQIISTRILKPSGVNPIMAGWDQGVWRSPGISTYPSTKGVTDNTGSTVPAAWDIDCAAGTTVVVALVGEPGGGGDVSGKSTDGGQTWSKFSTNTFAQGTLRGGMIAASTSTNYVVVQTDNGSNTNQPYYTTDGGATWTAITISGISTTGPTGWCANYYDDNHTLCADRVNANTFYIYNSGTQPGVYKSTNGGSSWTRVRTTAFSGGSAARLVSVPSNAGHLFYCSGRFALSTPVRSTDAGSTWSNISNLGGTWCFGFGKALAGGGGYPAIYAAGYDTTNTVFGIRRSVDNAVSWQLLPNSMYPANSLDNINDITGDMDNYGDVYIALRGASSGSGFRYINYP